MRIVSSSDILEAKYGIEEAIRMNNVHFKIFFMSRLLCFLFIIFHFSTSIQKSK